MPKPTVNDFTDMGPQPITQTMLDNDPDGCELCGGEVPTFAKHGLNINEDGRYICSDCSKSEGMGGYHIEDSNGNRIYG